MPSDDLLTLFQQDLKLVNHWQVNGRHYERTANQWLANMDAHRAEILPILAATYGKSATTRWWVYWRVFFMACAELFGIPARQAVGQPFSSLVSHLEQQEEFDRAIAAIWSTLEAPPAREWHVERQDGRRLWQLRLKGPFSASPVASGQHIYTVNEKGRSRSLTAPLRKAR